MLRRMFIALSLAAFATIGVPVVSQEAGISDVSAQAAPKRKAKRVWNKQQKKWQYQYLPTSSGRAGRWN